MKGTNKAAAIAAYKKLVAGGRKGGSARSDAKTKACRKNARLPRRKDNGNEIV
jgi:hypothetical protein